MPGPRHDTHFKFMSIFEGTVVYFVFKKDQENNTGPFRIVNTYGHSNYFFIQLPSGAACTLLDNLIHVTGRFARIKSKCTNPDDTEIDSNGTAIPRKLPMTPDTRILKATSEMIESKLEITLE